MPEYLLALVIWLVSSFHRKENPSMQSRGKSWAEVVACTLKLKETSFYILILCVPFSHFRYNVGESAIGDNNILYQKLIYGMHIHKKQYGNTELFYRNFISLPHTPTSRNIWPWILTHRIAASSTFWQIVMHRIYLKMLTAVFKQDSAIATYSCACSTKAKAC